jgi:hypothetical protein
MYAGGVEVGTMGYLARLQVNGVSCQVAVPFPTDMYYHIGDLSIWNLFDYRGPCLFCQSHDVPCLALLDAKRINIKLWVNFCALNDVSDEHVKWCSATESDLNRDVVEALVGRFMGFGDDYLGYDDDEEEDEEEDEAEYLRYQYALGQITRAEYLDLRRDYGQDDSDDVDPFVPPTNDQQGDINYLE